MKLSNILKKAKKTEVAKVQKIEKDQLEKIVGGADTKPITAIGNVDAGLNLRL